MSNNLDPDQARHFVRPDLGPNCLLKLSADEASRKIVKWNLTIADILLEHSLKNINSFPQNALVNDIFSINGIDLKTLSMYIISTESKLVGRGNPLQDTHETIRIYY